MALPTSTAKALSFQLRPSTSESSFDIDDGMPEHRHGLRYFLGQLMCGLPPIFRQGRFAFEYLTNRTGSAEVMQDGREEQPRATTSQTVEASRRLWRAQLCKKILVALPVLILSVFGILHLLQVALGRSRVFWDPDEIDMLPEWGMPGETSASFEVLPIPCHSHNDYTRRVPLFDALHHGCTGVEADVWLSDAQLLVGHSKAALTPNRTFRTLYLDPIERLLELANTTDHGIFDMDANQTLVLLVDVKTDGRKTFSYVSQQLERLRSQNYLTYWDGNEVHSRPITVVGTGNTPFEMVVENTEYRDIFFDAPLDQLTSVGNDTSATIKFDTSNSYYASVSFKHAVGPVRREILSASQTEIIRGQIAGAKSRGLKARYWDTPAWPINFRNHIWSVLVDEGVDFLNVDDLRSAAWGDWKIRVHDLGL